MVQLAEENHRKVLLDKLLPQIAHRIKLFHELLLNPPQVIHILCVCVLDFFYLVPNIDDFALVEDRQHSPGCTVAPAVRQHKTTGVHYDVGAPSHRASAHRTSVSG